MIYGSFTFACDTMDRIEQLYQELIAYDPALASNKEQVLSLIKNMVAAKPAIVVSEKWKQQFAERLADHIEATPAVALRAHSFWGVSKWAVSFVSFFALLLVA